MADCHHLFQEFNSQLVVPQAKQKLMTASKKNLRDCIRTHFKEEHPGYTPTFYIQGSRKTKNMIRTKDDTCDLDDGVYFKENPDNVNGTTLQSWVKKAVDGITDATPAHRKKCITVDFKAGYNIDMPVFVFNAEEDDHPWLAVKNEDFATDDPKEFIDEFNRVKDAGGQLIRITKYLKSWCDYTKKKMPSGLSMTVLAMKHWKSNSRDDVAMKYTLIEIERELKRSFVCTMPTTPGDDLFGDFDKQKREYFMNNLASFVKDAKKAVDEEKNELKASRLWRDHFGKTYFPEGEDVNEDATDASRLSNTIGNAKPYAGQ